MQSRHLFGSLIGVVGAASIAMSATLENGVLTVDGRPFYPLGGWDEQYTTPQDIARLGMNTSFRHGAPTTPDAEVKFRGVMRECAALGIQVMPYLSYGGAGVNPWPPESVRAVSRIADEPNLLAWYVGDDITMKHLEGIRQTVTILREESPTVPTVADYIAEETPEAQTVFTKFVDIRCQYDYPLPKQSYASHLRFFERQRKFVGDPLWTWVQSFMWGSTGRDHRVAVEEGPAPIPDPEQVRLLSFAAINRGVRGLLYFSHRELHRRPGVASMVALTCREVRLVSDHLAAGTPTYGLTSSHADLDATAFTHRNSVVLSVALLKPTYHRWVDEGIVENVTVDCPWADPAKLPQAALIATPDVVKCSVTRGTKPGTVRVTIPSLEFAGFVLVTTDERELSRLRNGVLQVPATLLPVASPGAVAQTQKVAGMVWKMGFDRNSRSPDVLAMTRASEACANATAEQRAADAVVAWKTAMRIARAVVDRAMHEVEARRYNVPPEQQLYLYSPWSLHNIHGLRDVAEETPWQPVREWMIAGPFPLEWNKEEPEDFETIPPGLARAYPPEGPYDRDARFTTVDGPASWQKAKVDISGMLDFGRTFRTTANSVAYARCRIIAPRNMGVTLSLGSNDGAKLWVNGKQVYMRHIGRIAIPHQDKITVHLRSGPNTILVKVENLGGGWHLFLSVDDAKRELRFDVD